MAKAKKKKKSGSTKSQVHPEAPLEAAVDISTSSDDNAEPFETSENASENTSENTEAQKKFQLEFYGSEILRQKAPQAFELAEAVADDWVNDGNFQKLPLNHPLAQLVAAVSLKGAKQIEKKLEERGVFTLAKMGFEIAKSKLPESLYKRSDKTST